jgi:nucleoid-associated protein YgaU
VSSNQRHPETNEVTDAVATFTLTEASDAAPAVGPVNPPPPPPPPAAPPSPRTYVVVKGDCLWKIAQHFYGQGTLWPRIFDANRGQIKDPHWIYPGQRFVIP